MKFCLTKIHIYLNNEKKNRNETTNKCRKINDNRTFQNSLFELFGRSDTSSAYISTLNRQALINDFIIEKIVSHVEKYVWCSRSGFNFDLLIEVRLGD